MSVEEVVIINDADKIRLLELNGLILKLQRDMFMSKAAYAEANLQVQIAHSDLSMLLDDIAKRNGKEGYTIDSNYRLVPKAQ